MLYVADQQESLDFYVELLGFTKTVDVEAAPGWRWIEVVPPGAQTAIAIHDAAAAGKQPGEGAYLTFACDDIQATVTQLRESGAIVTDPVSEPWGTWAKINGPDGHDVQIHQK